MPEQTASPFRVVPEPKDRLLYAIGDVHGRLDLLDRVLTCIERDADGEPHALMFLGDYIDRGPDSAGVIARIIALGHVPGAWVGALRGNHEEQLLEFLESPSLGPQWLDYGGRNALASYGVAAPRLRTDAADWNRTARELAEAMPPAHLSFLKALALGYEWGRFVFVHAGVRPGVALHRQAPADLVSIRSPFLEARDPAPARIVVFGHTPTDRVRVQAGKIGVDTGAYATGVLSALAIRGDELAVLDSRGAREQLDPVEY